MPTIAVRTLADFVARIFVACGTPPENARIVADSLTLANQTGHDSHGVLRVLEYVPWIAKGWIVPEAQLEIVRETDSLLLADGHFGFGQVVGRTATDHAIARAKVSGVCVLSLRRSGHLGRIGEWAERAADAGLFYFSFTNTHGGGVLVAPYGGRERRLSANPLGGGVPVPGRGPIVVDIATSCIAEGKIKVARAKKEPLPPGCIVNAQGEPSTDPEEYYTDPPGALLPFGDHKGYGLSVLADLFAGALSGAGCSRKGQELVANAQLALLLDPAAFSGADFVARESADFVAHVTDSLPLPGFEKVQLPGDPERRAREERQRDGVPIDEATWGKIVALGEGLGVAFAA